MQNIIEVNSVAEYIEYVQKLYQETKPKKHLFFRGHSKISYELVPSVFRANISEKDVLLDFRQYAPEHLIAYDFIYECDKVLGDMQHFGLPTRLLDWTISPLVALYFASKSSKNEKDEAGRLFIFNPWDYNQAIIDDYTIPEIHQVHIIGRALLAYQWKLNEIVDYLKRKFINVPLTKENIQKPISFISPYTNKRKLTQRGCFTIHGNDRACLDNWDESKKSMWYLTIRKETKDRIREELNILYINDYSIFPDYNGMSTMVDACGSLFNWKYNKKGPA